MGMTKNPDRMQILNAAVALRLSEPEADAVILRAEGHTILEVAGATGLDPSEVRRAEAKVSAWWRHPSRKG